MNYRIRLIIIFLLIILTAVTCIDPLYPRDQLLQHLGTVLLLLPLCYDQLYPNLSFGSFSGIVIFTAVHIIGARYVYSFVPYNEWVYQLSGVDLKTYFGFDRNHYDRFVHFGFGLLFFPYAVQLTQKMKLSSKSARLLVAWCFIQSFSLFYELFEWALTLVMASEIADNYNGQQGDMWDAQKDMALAMLGATLGVGYYSLRRKNELLNE